MCHQICEHAESQQPSSAQSVTDGLTLVSSHLYPGIYLQLEVGTTSTVSEKLYLKDYCTGDFKSGNFDAFCEIPLTDAGVDADADTDTPTSWTRYLRLFEDMRDRHIVCCNMGPLSRFSNDSMRYVNSRVVQTV